MTQEMEISAQDVARAREGDREAFGRLYDGVARELYRVALYTLGNPQDAENNVAETFLETWKGIHTIREEASFRQWIMRILSIRCKRRIGGYVKEKGNIDIEDYIEEGVPYDTAPRAEVREAMGRLGLTDPRPCLMVGDRKYDVLGARECGISCVGVSFFGYALPGELEEAGAIAIVDSAAALEKFLLEH